MDLSPDQIIENGQARARSQQPRPDKSAARRHVQPGSLGPLVGPAWPISAMVLSSLRRSAAFSQNAAWGYAYGQPDRLLQAARRAAAEQWDFLAPAHAVEKALQDVREGPLSDATKRSVVAALAQHLPRTLDRSLPPSILDLYPRAVTTLAGSLEDGRPYDEDLFAKDIRFVSGAAVPAGAQAVDVLFSSSPASHLGRLRRMAGTVGRLVRNGEVHQACSFLAHRGMGDWLQIHTDTRDISDFNPEGWDRCYHRVADLLVARPKLAGMLGISWFYDPSLEEISPRLSYLRERPLRNGAFLVRLRASALDAERAGAASPTRRRLIKAGTYLPVCHALFWPRRELLQWANKIDRMGVTLSPMRFLARSENSRAFAPDY